MDKGKAFALFINLQNFIIMVTITGYQPRETQEGKTFFAITLQGEVKIAQSETGNFYLTADKTTVTTSFNEAMCQMLIGKKLAGSIKKVECEPYQYTNRETGEEMTLTHKFQYSPKEEANAVKSVNPTMQLHTAQQEQTMPFGLVNAFTGEMAAA